MRPLTPHPRSIRGFTLIELMVAVVIGLVLTLAISSMVARQESVRRGLTSGSDLTGNSAFVAYTLDRDLRSAGAGFSQAFNLNYGCVLNVSRDNAQLLPATAALPAPFSGLPQQYRLAPVLVHAGEGEGGSDVIAVATGASALAESAIPVVGKSTSAGQLLLPNTLGLRGGDLILLAEATRGCMLQQVSDSFVGGAGQTLTFGGKYAANVINGVALTALSHTGNAYASVLGNVAGNQPRLTLYGIGANATLFSYDLLRLDGRTTPLPMTDGVVDLRVRYGIASGGGAVVTAWVTPTGDFAAANLANGTSSAQANLQSILALRVGLIMRSTQLEREKVTPESLKMFESLGASNVHTFSVPSADQLMRHRVIEFTVPLRNIRWSGGVPS